LDLYDANVLAVLCPQHLPQEVILYPLACSHVLITLQLSIHSVHTKVDRGNHVVNSLVMSALSWLTKTRGFEWAITQQQTEGALRTVIAVLHRMPLCGLCLN
jgi:hypothetical protein